jgi:hypothetical protein
MGDAPDTKALLMVAPPVMMPVARNTYPLLPVVPGVDPESRLSIMQALAEDGVQGTGPPRDPISGANPTVGYAV